MSLILKGINLPKDGTVINLIVQSDGEAQYITLGDGELIIVKEAQAIQIPKSHGKIVDLDDLVVKYWDGNYMEIDNEAYDNAVAILEAEE